MVKRLFLLDAYALIFRAYYALIKMPRMTQTGFNTSAIFGFVNTLEEILRKENPSHIAVCFDPQGPTFRNEAYEDYKAERSATPEDIKLSVPIIKDIVRAYRIPVVEVEGYEADDVIGTLARKAEKEGFTTYMMTPDKDFGQLVSPAVLQYKPSYRGQDFELRGEEEVCQRYGIQRPEQVIDLLALMGDKIDNIPGCPGVGEKTAVKLIDEFGSVENLLDNTDKLKGALKRKVEKNREQILFSKFLATIKTDVPIDIKPDELKRQPEDADKIRAIFNDLEFRTLLDRVMKRIAQAGRDERDGQSSAPSLFDDADFDTPAEPTRPFAQLAHLPNESTEPGTPTKSTAPIEPGTPTLTILDNAEAVRAFSDALLPCEECGIAMEAEGENDMSAKLTGAAVAAPDGRCGYIPADSAEGMAFFLDLLARPDICKVSANTKRDYVLAARLRRELTGDLIGEPKARLAGNKPPMANSDTATMTANSTTEPPMANSDTATMTAASPAEAINNYYDIGLAHYMLQPEMRHDLPNLIAQFNINLPESQFNINLPENQFNINLQENQDLLSPAGRIAHAALSSLMLREPLEKLLAAESEDMRRLLYDVEFPLVRVLAEMEITGVRIDVKALNEAAKDMENRIDTLEKEIFELAGTKFNVGSPAKVGEILFDRLQLDPKAKRTKTGQYSTSEDILEKLIPKHPIVEKILKFRQLRKLLNTYLTALPANINPETGKVHTNYNQTVTATGRISSSVPNLQNIPVRDDEGREIRRAFIADPGDLFLSADYSQIELRLVADFADDEIMIDAFRHNKDIHAITAAKIYHKEQEEVTANERRNAKTANFGILYGISAFGLASRLGIPRGEAKELIDNYFATFPTIHRYMSSSVEQAREHGYVTTRMGRKRILPDINSRNPVVRGYAERNAINAPVQGSAADIIKVAMVRIAEEMREKKLRSRMIMQVHDELNFNVVPEELATMQELVERQMAGAYTGRVPLTASCGVGPDWLSAH